MQWGKTRGPKPKYVTDPDGRPIVGLSYDKGNGQYFCTHWRIEGLKVRPNFGSDQTIAIIRFMDWDATRKKKTVVIEQKTERPFPYTVPIFEGDKIRFEQDTHKIENFTFDKALSWQVVRQEIAKDKDEAQKMMGIQFTIVDLECSIPLAELLEKFKQKPIYQVNNMPASRKSELREIGKTWEGFLSCVKKKTVNELNKSDVLNYCNKTIQLYHMGIYLTQVATTYSGSSVFCLLPA